jgi:hypothetical protein
MSETRKQKMNDDPPDVIFACSLTSCFLVDFAQQQQQFKIPASL